MIGNISFYNNLNFIPVKKQEQKNYANAPIEKQNAFKSPSSGLLKAIYFGGKKNKKLFEKSDINANYESLDLSSAERKNKYCKLIQLMARKKLGVDIDLPYEITGVKFQKELYAWLEIYKELGMPLPLKICLFDERWEKNKEGKNIKITSARFRSGYDHYNKIPVSEIHINKNVFTDEYKSFSKIEGEREFLDNLHKVFYHEMVHLEHKNVQQGFTCILNEEEKQIYNKYKELIQKHSEEFNQQYPVDIAGSGVDVDKDFNLKRITTKWNAIKDLLSSPDKLSDAVKQDFHEDFIEKLNPVMDKLCKAKETIDRNLEHYAFKNSGETIAISAEKEFMKGPIEDEELSKLLKELGKKESKLFTSLPEGYLEKKS